MKTLLTILSLAVLGGCAYAPPAPPNYAAGYPAPADPSQWHVVSVTPVAPGTGQQRAASSDAGGSVQYTSEPIAASAPAYAAAPVYVQQPVYVAQPMYYAPAPSYYYPPVSIGLDFVFGSSWGGHGHGHGRNWGGVGVGTRGHR